MLRSMLRTQLLIWIKPIGATLIEFSLKHMPTSIILLPYIASSFHSFADHSLSTSPVFETCMIHASSLDRTNELDVTIGLEDWIEDLGSMPTLYVHASCKTSRPLSSTLNDV